MKPGAAVTADNPHYSVLQRWSFLAVLLLAATAAAMDRNVMSILFEPIKHEFNLSDRMLGLLGGAPFGICFALSSLPLAQIADRTSRKMVLLMSFIAWTAMTALCGVAVSLPMLFIARMGVGLAEGGSHPPSHALIASYFPPERRSFAFAIFTASGAIGQLVAATVGGWAAHLHGWRMAFIAMAIISAPVALLIVAVLREPPRALPIHRPLRIGWPRADVAALLRKRSYRYLLLGAFLFCIMPFGVIVFTPAYMTRILHLDVAAAGRVFGLAAALGTVLGALAGGAMADRFRHRGEQWLLRIPALAILFAFVIAIPTYLVGSVPLFFALNTIMVASLYATSPGMFATVQYVCGENRRATATAVLFTVMNAFGLVLAPLLTGALSDLFAKFDPARSLQFAILSAACLLIPSAWMLLRGGAHLHADRED